MKNIILLSTLFVAGTTMAQTEPEKKVQAGVSVATGLNLNTPGTKRMETNGVGNAFSIGLATNVNISNTIAFATGLDIEFETNKIKPSSTIGQSYYQYNDTKIELSEDAKPTNSVFEWTERKQKPIYLTVPTMLLFRTKFFGDFRYFAKFGLRTSFLLGNKINDLGYNVPTSGPKVEAENTTMKAARDMNFFRSSAGIALGTEWNFSGPTSLMAEIGYYYGFVPIYAQNKVDKQSTYYYDIANPGSPTYYSNDMTQSQLQLKISVLF